MKHNVSVFAHFIKLSFFSIFMLLTACEQAAEINNVVQQNEQMAQDAIASISPDDAIQSPLQVVNKPWYGSEAISVNSGQALPQNMTGANALTLTFAGNESMSDITRKIESVTDIPVYVSDRFYTPQTNGGGTIAEFLPAGGQEVSGGRIVWSGSLQGILNQMARHYDADWKYEAGIIKFVTENTKTFMLNTLASELTLSGTAESTSSGSGSAPQISMGGTTTLEIWGEISEAIDTIMAGQGQASYSPSTGTITVTARPDILRRVENYLRYQNEKRLRRIAISVKVLSITTADNQSYGVDIGGMIKAALGSSLTVAGVSNGSSGLDLNIIKNPTFTEDGGLVSSVGVDPEDIIDNAEGDVLSAIRASKGVERATIVHSGSLVTLSDQPAPLQVGREIAYLERVSSSGGDAASVSLEPGTIEVGLFMTVLPRIIDNDKVLMRLSLALTDADPNFRQFGTDEIQIELPEIETTGFLQNAVLGNGETLVLAGFEKQSNSLTDAKTPAGFALGGTRTMNQGRELLVLMINSRILPEQPLTIIGE